MTLTPLSQIRVGVLQPDGAGRQVAITESPFYNSLWPYAEKVFHSYRDVLMIVSGTPETEMTWGQFLELRKSIMIRGFIIQEPKIRFDDEMVCLDGHHRLAVVAFYFPHTFLEIENFEVQSLWVKSSK